MNQILPPQSNPEGFKLGPQNSDPWPLWDFQLPQQPITGQDFPPFLIKELGANPPKEEQFVGPTLPPLEPSNPLTKEELREILESTLENQNSSSRPLGEEDLKNIREMIREENSNIPISPVTYFSIGIAVTAFVIAVWNFWRASSKIKQDFDSRRSDREELLFGREPSVVEEPKQLLIQETPALEQGSESILEVDDPRLELMSFNPDRDFGPYTLDIAKRAAALCTPDDPFLLEHFNQVPIPRFEWFLDAGAERDTRHMWGSLRVKHDVICERALKRFKRELKILVEKAYSEGAIDALEGKSRKRQNLFAVPLSDVKPDGTWTMKFLVISEGDLEKLRHPETLRRMLEDNPEKRREIEMLASAEFKEREFQSQQVYEPAQPPLHRPGHSRFTQQRRVGRYMIAVGGWLRPKNGKT